MLHGALDQSIGALHTYVTGARRWRCSLAAHPGVPASCLFMSHLASNDTGHYISVAQEGEDSEHTPVQVGGRLEVKFAEQL